MKILKSQRSRLLSLGVLVVLLSQPASAVPDVLNRKQSVDRFDPVLEALGVDSDGEIRTLQEAQYRIADDGRRSEIRKIVEIGEDGRPIKPVDVPLSDTPQHRFGAAIDELYDRVAEHSEAEAGRRQWRQCMLTAGYKFASPVAIESALIEASVIDEPNVEHWQGIFAARDSCNDSIQVKVDKIARELFPQWQEENAGVIEEYAQELGLG